ncbi:hypothetical protein [Rhizobium sp. Root651]|uniref:hypothetical protein n=1 Tax=Rhizobium sp. Root651 TaxID=1736577 RepID=UPI000ABC8525|nr:hypothetical protein [Rhizobium sp. Root651]
MKKEAEILLNRWAEDRAEKRNISRRIILAQFPDPETWSDDYATRLCGFLRKEMGRVH